MAKAWKNAEREVAESLGGVRVVRLSYSESSPDVLHPSLAVEVKYGDQVPKHLNVDGPTILTSRKTGFCYTLMPYKSLFEQHIFYDRREVASCGFLERGLAQAKSYPDTQGKMAVLCLKPKRYRTFIICMLFQDYFRWDNGNRGGIAARAATQAAI